MPFSIFPFPRGAQPTVIADAGGAMIDARAAMVATTPMVRATLALVLVASVDAHGAVTIPPPRQALDADLAPWSGAVPSPIPFGEGSDGSQFWCASPSASAAGGPSALRFRTSAGCAETSGQPGF
jgi:hypothetical protein